MISKTSPRNRIFSGSPVLSMTFYVDGTNEYEVPIKVKNKKGKGYRLRVVKVKTTDEEELRRLSLPADFFDRLNSDFDNQNPELSEE